MQPDATLMCAVQLACSSERVQQGTLGLACRGCHTSTLTADPTAWQSCLTQAACHLAYQSTINQCEALAYDKCRTAALACDQSMRTGVSMCNSCGEQLQSCKSSCIVVALEAPPAKRVLSACLQQWPTLGLLARCVRLVCHDKGVHNDWQRKGLPQTLKHQAGQPISACTIAACQPDYSR